MRLSDIALTLLLEMVTTPLRLLIKPSRFNCLSSSISKSTGEAERRAILSLRTFLIKSLTFCLSRKSCYISVTEKNK